VFRAPQTTDAPPHVASHRPDFTTAAAPPRNGTERQVATEERWDRENQQWRRILEGDATGRPAPVPTGQREGFPASREEAWENYSRARLVEQATARQVITAEEWYRSRGAGPSHVAPEQVVADARHALGQARQYVSGARDELRAWGNHPERLDRLHEEWQQRSLRHRPRLLGSWDPFGRSLPHDLTWHQEWDEFMPEFLGHVSDSTQIRESSSPGPGTADYEPASELDFEYRSSEEWMTIHSFASEHGIPPSTMRSWARGDDRLTSRDNPNGRRHAQGALQEYRRSDLEELRQAHASYSRRVVRDFDADVEITLQAIDSGRVEPTAVDIREYLRSDRAYAVEVRNRVIELRHSAPSSPEVSGTYEEDSHWGGGYYTGWWPPGAPRLAQASVGSGRTGPESTERPPEEGLADPQGWKRRRVDAPVTRIETERFEPATRAVPSRGRIPGATTRISHDIRRIQLPSGLWVREFTLRLHLRPDRDVSTDQVIDLQNRVTDTFRNHINQRYRFTDGDQFHVRIEFDTPFPHALVDVHNGINSDQENWSTAAPGGVLTHEVMHFLGLRNRYPDENLLFRRHSRDSPGVMGTDSLAGPPVLTGADLREIEDVTVATNVLRSLPPQPHDAPRKGTSMPQSTLQTGSSLRQTSENATANTASMATDRAPAAPFPGSTDRVEVAHYISAVLDPPSPVSSPLRGPQQDERRVAGQADVAGVGLPHTVGPAGRREMRPTAGKPSVEQEQVSRALGKLSEARYEELSAQVDPFVRTDMVIGDDVEARRSRSAQETLRGQVIHALHRFGEKEARRLAGELGIARTRGLPGGWDNYGSYSPRADDDLLYRDDSRPPDEIFEEGFHPRSPGSPVSHWDHMWGRESNWVSTSRRSDLRKVRGYRYEVDAPGSGLDAKETYGDDYPSVFRPEQEVAFEGGIDRSQILGSGEEERTPAGLASLGAGDGSDSFFLVNPHFQYPAEADEYSWPGVGTGSSTPEWYSTYGEQSPSYRSDEDEDFYDA
jgi:hypothetical protein